MWEEGEAEGVAQAPGGVTGRADSLPHTSGTGLRPSTAPKTLEHEEMLCLGV